MPTISIEIHFLLAACALIVFAVFMAISQKASGSEQKVSDSKSKGPIACLYNCIYYLFQENDHYKVSKNLGCDFDKREHEIAFLKSARFFSALLLFVAFVLCFMPLYWSAPYENLERFIILDATTTPPQETTVASHRDQQEDKQDEQRGLDEGTEEVSQSNDEEVNRSINELQVFIEKNKLQLNGYRVLFIFVHLFILFLCFTYYYTISSKVLLKREILSFIHFYDINTNSQKRIEYAYLSRRTLRSPRYTPTPRKSSALPIHDVYYIFRTIENLGQSFIKYNSIGLLSMAVVITTILVFGYLVFDFFQDSFFHIHLLSDSNPIFGSVLLMLRTSLIGSLLITFMIYIFRFMNSSFDQAVRFNKRKHAALFLVQTMIYDDYAISKVKDAMEAFNKWNTNIESAFTHHKSLDKKEPKPLDIEKKASESIDLLTNLNKLQDEMLKLAKKKM